MVKAAHQRAVDEQAIQHDLDALQCFPFVWVIPYERKTP
jgi:hypothetical protein